MKKDTHGRKIPFENIIRNLRMRRYSTYVSDYANAGVEIFLEKRFASNLGVSVEKLFEVGILKKGNQNGWTLTMRPNYKDIEEILRVVYESPWS